MVKCVDAGLQFTVSRVRNNVRVCVWYRVGVMVIIVVRVSTFYFLSHYQPTF